MQFSHYTGSTCLVSMQFSPHIGAQSLVNMQLQFSMCQGVSYWHKRIQNQKPQNKSLTGTLNGVHAVYKRSHYRFSNVQ